MLTTLLPLFLIFMVYLGPGLGSFFGLQVVREAQVFRGKYGKRSECDSCGHRLAWYDMVPLISYLALRGKCRYCGKRVSPKLFIVEVLGLVLYLLFAAGIWGKLITDGIARDLFVTLIVQGSIISILFYFAVYDIFTMSVPAKRTQIATIYVVIVNAVFLVQRMINPALLPQITLGDVGHLVMGVVSGAFIYAIIRLTKHKGMGVGDLLIAVMIGLALGWPQTVSAFYVMIFSASLFGLALAAVKRKFHGLQVPLVPFMVLGYVVALMWGDQIFRLLFFAV